MPRKPNKKTHQDADSKQRKRVWIYVFHFEKFFSSAQEAYNSFSFITHSKFHDDAVQLEKCPKTGKLHLQGVVKFQTSVRFKAMKNLLHRTVHLKPVPSDEDFDQVAKYSNKEESCVFAEDGVSPVFRKKPSTKSEKGKRTDLENLKTIIDSSGSLESCWHASFSTMVKYHQAIGKYQSIVQKPRTKKPRVEVHWGVTRTGKSGFAWMIHGFEAAFAKNHSKRFDGLDIQKHKVIIFDDFRGDSISIQVMLTILDRYPLMVEQKGNSISFDVPTIVITSNVDPRDWYPGADRTSKDALLARFDVEIEYSRSRLPAFAGHRIPVLTFHKGRLQDAEGSLTGAYLWLHSTALPTRKGLCFFFGSAAGGGLGAEHLAPAGVLRSVYHTSFVLFQVMMYGVSQRMQLRYRAGHIYLTKSGQMVLLQ